MRSDALKIVENVIKELNPSKVLKEYLEKIDLPENLYVVAVGKAAWDMAKTAKDYLNGRISSGFVLTKHGHSKGLIPGFKIREASHPVPDESSVRASEKLLEFLRSISGNVLFLLSGGASSLFEIPEEGLSVEDISETTSKLLKSGADIYELNAVRKRISKVKGGKLARMFRNLKFTELIISDVIGDRVDVIGSGPLHEDESSPEFAMEVAKKYGLPEKVQKFMDQDLSGKIENVSFKIISNVERACEVAKASAKELGYDAKILGCSFDGEARELGRFLGKVAKEIVERNRPFERPCAMILGGETTVTVKGDGKGGRNQELALSAALEIYSVPGVIIVAFGTDGTDGPTDVAGAIVDGESVERMKESGVDPKEYLERNDSYNALKASGDLLKTGPTGTNVNDIYFALCR